MAFTAFHPVVRQWFTTQVGEPTSAQLRGWESIAAGRHTLIAAPTGSGKTLAAFLSAINTLLEESHTTQLPDEVRVVYVSPLKALSADIHKNLAEPCTGIQRLAEAAGVGAPRITAAVRTGDTTPAERAAMLRTPPHILVTTPESLYLLLTADRSREMLRTVRTVIVDEIHAVIGSRRGAHLALTPRTARGRCRPSTAAHRTVRDPDAHRGGRQVSHGRRRIRLHHRRRRPPPPDGPRGRDPALDARGRDVPRSLGRILRPPGRC